LFGEGTNLSVGMTMAEATPQTAVLLQAVSDGAQVFVPALWPLEVSNALLVLERRKELVAAERKTALLALQKLQLHRLPWGRVYDQFNAVVDRRNALKDRQRHTLADRGVLRIRHIDVARAVHP
jgi:hypothetical protein